MLWMNLVGYIIGKISVLTFTVNNLKCNLFYFYIFVEVSIQKDTKICNVNKESELGSHITISFFAKYFEV